MACGVKVNIVPFHITCPHLFRFFFFLNLQPPFRSLSFSHCPSHIHMELDLWPATANSFFSTPMTTPPTPALSWGSFKASFFFWAQRLNNLSSLFIFFFFLPSNPNSRKQLTRSTPYWVPPRNSRPTLPSILSHSHLTPHPIKIYMHNFLFQESRFHVLETWSVITKHVIRFSIPQAFLTT